MSEFDDTVDFDGEDVSLDVVADDVIKVNADEWLLSEYIVYSQYVNYQRAIPGRDGLKPVQRRILWSMYTNGETDKARYKKAQMVSSNVNDYHPHGDSSISGALAILAQKFKTRVPLIDYYGSVGEVQGDTAAAPRYWEARLSSEAMEMIRDVDYDAVPMLPNFDGEKKEPLYLPARFPNSIINGCLSGIAVGHATQIPPHNPNETIDAVKYYIKNNDASVDDILAIMPGPDFPTGGDIYETDGIKSYYENGKGTFTIRGKYKIESGKRGSKRIVFYELPFDKSADNIIIEIQNHSKEQKARRNNKQVIVPPNPIFVKNIADVKDLTDKKNGLKLVITTKEDANIPELINELFDRTSVQIKYSTNITIIQNNSIKKSNMLDLIKNFVDLRRDVVVQRFTNSIEKELKKLEQVDALLAIVVDIDKAIDIIRNSENAEEAKLKLIESFSINEVQSDYILAMQLRKLTKSDSLALENDKLKLNESISEKRDILASHVNIDDYICEELDKVKSIIKSDRRSVIHNVSSNDLKNQSKVLAQRARDAKKNTPCYVTLFANGKLLRSDEPFEYNLFDTTLKYSPIIESFKMRTKDKLVIVGSDGNGYKMNVGYLADNELSTLEDVGVYLENNATIVGISKEIALKSDVGIALATRYGEIKIVKADFPSSEVFPLIKLKDGDAVIGSCWLGRTIKDTHFALVSDKGNIIIFDADSINPTGHKAGGVRGMKLNDANVIYFTWVQSIKDTSIVTISNKTIKHTSLSDIPTKNRGGMGVATQSWRAGETGLRQVGIAQNIIAMSEDNKVFSLPAIMDRTARGYLLDVPPILIGSKTVISM